MIRRPPFAFVLVLSLAALAACSSLGGGGLAKEPPPLADMEEPVGLLHEPDDEAARLALPPGCFSGIRLAEAAKSLDELTSGGAAGVEVADVVENSPAEAAGIETGDLLLEAAPEGGAAVVLANPSDWRGIEIGSAPGTRVGITFDRAGVERTTSLVLVPRVRPAAREEAPRLREESKVGVVLRGATEVEARAASLPPGGGAVVVGLSRRSPWRPAGVRFGDLIESVDGRSVGHPQVVLDAISAAPEDGTLALGLRRDGAPVGVDAPVTARESGLEGVSIIPLFSHESKPGFAKTSILLGLFGWEETPAAWEFQFLWLIRFSGGESDELMEANP